MNLIGIDVGTQSVRVCVFRTDGLLLAKEEVYFTKTRYPRPNFAEQDPQEWWDATVLALKRIFGRSNVNAEEVIALSYGCTSCTAVFLDKFGNPVRPAIIWMDKRGSEEARFIQETNNEVLFYAGGSVSPEWMLPKVLWVKNHQPEIYEESSHIVEQIDYFSWKFTGKWVLGYNHLVAKWNYSKQIGGWNDGFLESLRLQDLVGKIPEKVLLMGDFIGFLLPEVADKIGIKKAIPIYQGGMDSAAGMLGLGAFNPGELGISVGTSSVIQCQSKEIIEEVRCRRDALAEGFYLIGGGESTAGAIAQWFVKLLSRDSIISYQDYYSELESEVDDVPPGSSGLVVLDHFQGSRSFDDSSSRGVIWGLNLFHGAPHIMRAIYESVAYNIRLFIEKLENSTYDVTKIAAGGGLMQSKVFSQILSDVCNKPIYRVKEKEQTALGAAIVAGVGSGVFLDYVDAIKQMVRFSPPILPVSDHKTIYDFYFDKYYRTYFAINNLNQEVVAFEATINESIEKESFLQ
ncbi:MAG: FGGY family carbohydrate kinase [Anaerolineaceae bacterium]|jgi:ribulose kinase